MKNILVIGAGRSASSLIRYLLEQSVKEQWKVTVADMSLEDAKKKTLNHANGIPIAFDINNEQQRIELIGKADIVVSLLPVTFHILAAKTCVDLKKSMVTASYVSNEIKALDTDAKKAGIILMNEIGLDPGIDHMSAMKIIDYIKENGGKVISFKSYCGGLVAPEYNDNPWGYKFTWNPRNVVLAGQGTAQYIEDGEYKYTPYSRVFSQTEKINVEIANSKTVQFEGYANRDSLSYRKPYGLDNIPTILRGTLRMPGYCESWNAFVQLGLTDDTYKIADSEKLNYKQLLNAFLPSGKGEIKERLAIFLGLQTKSKVIADLDWLGILSEKTIELNNASPAQILQKLLEEKWVLKKNDIDMVVMQHQFQYVNTKKETKHITSSLIAKGEDQVYTAMAKTVGLPVGIAVKLILNEKIKSKGVVIPVSKEIYEPVLNELEEHGIIFTEKES